MAQSLGVNPNRMAIAYSKENMGMILQIPESKEKIYLNYKFQKFMRACLLKDKKNISRFCFWELKSTTSLKL